jgi:transposase-like protein
MPTRATPTRMKEAGRPTSYTPDRARQARLICELGATDAQLAAILGVHHDTVRRWRMRYPDFAEASRAGRAMADLRARLDLYRNAIGYDYTETRVYLRRGQAVPVEVTRHKHAQTGAALQWLRVRDPAWRTPRRRDDGSVS